MIMLKDEKKRKELRQSSEKSTVKKEARIFIKSFCKEKGQKLILAFSISLCLLALRFARARMLS
tara:strand:+ start:414 stop:605 length:192 start_codon:yes stop_codon:yes gene_type:complete